MLMINYDYLSKNKERALRFLSRTLLWSNGIHRSRDLSSLQPTTCLLPTLSFSEVVESHLENHLALLENIRWGSSHIGISIEKKNLKTELKGHFEAEDSIVSTNSLASLPTSLGAWNVIVSIWSFNHRLNREHLKLQPFVYQFYVRGKKFIVLIWICAGMTSF